MRLLITGGAGFVGTRLARSLLAQGALNDQPIDELVLADLAASTDPVLTKDGRVKTRTGDLLALIDTLMAEPFDAVFHLASAVSGECERDFDLGLHSNLDTTRRLLDACRAQSVRTGTPPLFVFSSTLAVFGPDPALPMPALIEDHTMPTPQTSYGTQKFACELLIADYTRKGFIDGRAARLVTVCVRPGRPNAAASSFVSGIVREPLAGRATTCPVDIDTWVALSSPQTTVDGLIAVAQASRDAFGGRTALTLPGLTVRVREMLDVLAEIGGDEARALVRFEPDAQIVKIVDGWPARVHSARAERIGLRPDPDFRSVLLQYVRDHPEAVNEHARRAAAAGGR